MGFVDPRVYLFKVHHLRLKKVHPIHKQVYLHRVKWVYLFRVHN